MSDNLELTKKLLADLIAFPVISDQSNLDIVNYIVMFLKNYGIESQLSYDSTGQKANIYATIGPDTDGGVMLSGHTDVVTTEGQHWQYPDFTLTQADDRLYGRGSVDMKGFLALSLAQVPELVKLDLRRPVHFGITYDEEIGSFGAQVLADYLQQQSNKPAYCIVGEPTEMKIIAAHKGGYEISTRIKGVEGHSSDPNRGVSAVHYAVRLINNILDLRQELEQKTDTTSSFKPACSTINIGTLNGGISRSTIAGECQFDWEIRLMPGEDGQAIVNQINKFVRTVLLPSMRKRFPKSDIETVIGAAYPGLALKTDSPVLSFMTSLADDDQVTVVPFGTDAGYFQQAGIETVVFGPGRIEQAHKADEYIEISELERCQVFMDRLIAWAQTG